MKKLKINLCENCAKELKNYNPYVDENGKSIPIEQLEINIVPQEKCDNLLIYKKNNYMKPEIGTKVYCIYCEGILVDNVAFIGNESFIIKSFGTATYEDSWEWYYEDYNNKWFTDLEKAKERLLSIAKERYDEPLKIVQTYDNWYQLEEDDE